MTRAVITVNERSSAADAFIGEVRTAQGRRALAVDWPPHWTVLHFPTTLHPHLGLSAMDGISYPIGLRSSLRIDELEGGSIVSRFDAFGIRGHLSFPV